MSHDSGPGRPLQPALSPGLTLVDLRADDARRTAPLIAPRARQVRTLTLEEIEDGAHGLTPAAGPVVVVCERGARSQLAARYLRADGLDAQAWPGGWDSFAAALKDS